MGANGSSAAVSPKNQQQHQQQQQLRNSSSGKLNLRRDHQAAAMAANANNNNNHNKLQVRADGTIIRQGNVDQLSSDQPVDAISGGSSASSSGNNKSGGNNKSNRRRPHHAIQTAAGMLSSFRKTLFHQLLFRKSVSAHNIPDKSSNNSRSLAHRGGDKDGRSSAPVSTTATAASPGHLPLRLAAGSSSQKYLSSADQQRLSSSKGGTSSRLRTSRSSIVDEIDSSCDDQHSSSRVASLNKKPNDLNKKLLLLPDNNGSTTTHVRIRISCSDSLHDVLRRNDAVTQTDESYIASVFKKNAAFVVQHCQPECTSASSNSNSNSSSNTSSNKENQQHSVKKQSLKGSASGASSKVVFTSSKPSESSGVISWSGPSASSEQESGDDSNRTVKASGNKEHLPQEPKAVVTRRTTIQASTGELLECLGQFVKNRFGHISGVNSATVVSWMRAIDRSLISQGWQDTPFISPGTVVFVYLLLRDSSMPHPSARVNSPSQRLSMISSLSTVSSSSSSSTSCSTFSAASSVLSSSTDQNSNKHQQRHNSRHHSINAAVDSVDVGLKPVLFDLHCHVNACLYLAYSYAGIEISYPQRPFIVTEQPPSTTPPASSGDFWTRCLDITLTLSDKMLRLNSDPLFFARTFAELKTQGVSSVATNTSATPVLSSHNSSHAVRSSLATSSTATNNNILHVAAAANHGTSVLTNSSSNNNNNGIKTIQGTNSMMKPASSNNNNNNNNNGRSSCVFVGTGVVGNCRTSAVAPGLNRERAGEHYTSLLI